MEVDALRREILAAGLETGGLLDALTARLDSLRARYPDHVAGAVAVYEAEQRYQAGLAQILRVAHPIRRNRHLANADFVTLVQRWRAA